MNSHRLKMIVVILGAMIAAGCETSGPTTKTFSHVRLPGTDRATAFSAAADAIRENHAISTIDRDQWMIHSVPEETEEEAATPRVGDLVGVARTVRRVVTAYVTGDDQNAEAWCRVAIERNESNEHNLFIHDMQSDDTATATPADREAATTTEQNSVWRTLRRDKRAERALLDKVKESVRPSN